LVCPVARRQAGPSSYFCKEWKDSNLWSVSFMHSFYNSNEL
jgi:hypothetical protein